jgi:hypothetical protein
MLMVRKRRKRIDGGEEMEWGWDEKRSVAAL